MNTISCVYPALRSLINEEFARLKQKRRPDASMRGAQKKVKVALGTLHTWKQGTAYPGADKIDRLVRYFYPDPGEDADRFRVKLEQARRGIRTVESLKRDPTLRVGYTNFPPFCQRQGTGVRGFMGELFARLTDLSMLQPAWQPFSDLSKGISNLFDGTCDVGLGIIDTISGPVGVHTFHSACRVTLNAVCLEPEIAKIERAREALMIGATTQPRPIAPMAQFNRIGYRYLRDTLGYKRDDIERVNSDVPSDVVRALRMHTPSGRIPVFVTEELSALEVLAEAGTGSLVFPLATEQSTQLGRRGPLPNYLLGLVSVNAQQKDLIDYLTHNLRLLLHSEIELVAMLYERLYADLRNHIKASLERLTGETSRILRDIQDEPSTDPDWNAVCAVRMTRHALRLNESDASHVLENLNLPWRDAIQRARSSIGPVPEGVESPNEGRLKLAYRPYTVFCRDLHGKTKVTSLDEFGFLGTFLKPFQRLIDTDHVRPLHQSSHLVDRAEQVDIRIGLFETIERNRNWRFFAVPSRIPLNAVLVELDHDLFLAQLAEARQVLTQGGPGYLQQIVEPVVLRAGSGFDYVTAMLGLPRICTVEVLHPSEYIKKLRDQRQGVRVVVVDLMTCLQILAHEEIEGKGRLVFPAAAGKRSSLPEYGLGIAFSRRSPHLAAFADSFPLLLDTHPQRVIRAFVDLYHEMYNFLRSCLARLTECGGLTASGFDGRVEEIAASWAKYMLYLNDASSKLPERYGMWGPILDDTRAEINSSDASGTGYTRST